MSEISNVNSLKQDKKAQSQCRHTTVRNQHNEHQRRQCLAYHLGIRSAQEGGGHRLDFLSTLRPLCPLQTSEWCNLRLFINPLPDSVLRSPTLTNLAISARPAIFTTYQSHKRPIDCRLLQTSSQQTGWTPHLQPQCDPAFYNLHLLLPILLQCTVQASHHASSNNSSHNRRPVPDLANSEVQRKQYMA